MTVPDWPRACRSIRHRGPDGEGISLHGTIGLGHTRLALLDPRPRSDQPLSDASGRYRLVYNGEIYNFRELARELEGQGDTFTTRSDTEVVLKGLMRHGAAFLRRLNGMFALAFVDIEQEEILLARDRFGIKPLYLCEREGVFAVASEIKALRPWVELEPDRLSITSYLLGFGQPTSGVTFYEGVEALAPGTYLRWLRGEVVEREQFFRLPEFWDQEAMARLDALSPSQAVDLLEERMWDAVTRADVCRCAGGRVLQRRGGFLAARRDGGQAAQQSRHLPRQPAGTVERAFGSARALAPPEARPQRRRGDRG